MKLLNIDLRKRKIDDVIGKNTFIFITNATQLHLSKYLLVFKPNAT